MRRSLDFGTFARGRRRLMKRDPGAERDETERGQSIAQHHLASFPRDTLSPVRRWRSGSDSVNVRLHPCGSRSEARRVGQECVRTCTSRSSPYHSTPTPPTPTPLHHTPPPPPPPTPLTPPPTP